MRSDPLSAADVLRALELFGPQARPYNFDDCFDCWGLVRRVFDHLDDGYEIDEELGPRGDPREAGWVAFAGPDELVPGDLLTTHPHAGEGFHTAFYCGRVDGLDLVYDSSPRALVPLFERRDDGWRHAGDRAIHTRYARATESTDRLRNDGGAYLRLWDERQAYYHRGLHARLLAGGAGEAAGRDLVALRRAAGLVGPAVLLRPAAFRETPRIARSTTTSPLAISTTTFPTARRCRTTSTKRSWREASRRGGRARRPLASPARRCGSCRAGPVVVEWEYPGAPDGDQPAGAGAAASTVDVDGCRIELWEETWDCWKHRLLRHDLDEPVTRFTVPEELLHDDSRFAVVVWARGPGGFSGTALAPFLYRPARDNPLLEYDPVRPQDLAPDGGALLPAGEPVELTWSIRQPLVSQSSWRVDVFEDAFLLDGAAPVFVAEAKGPAARTSRATVPGDVLRPGRTYAWYVTVSAADRRTAFAPAEGVFRVAREG